MKKLFCSFFALLIFTLLSCSGKAKTSEDSVSNDSMVVENAGAVEEEEVIIGDGYKITAKGIIPTTGRPMVVDFSTVWCTPCQELKPIFTGLKDEYAGRVDFVTIDADRMRDLTKSYGINNVPTLLFLDKDGEIKMQTTGYILADSIRKVIRKTLR